MRVNFSENDEFCINCYSITILEQNNSKHGCYIRADSHKGRSSTVLQLLCDKLGHCRFSPFTVSHQRHWESFFAHHRGQVRLRIRVTVNVKDEDKVDVSVRNKTIPIYKEDLPDFACELDALNLSLAASDVRGPVFFSNRHTPDIFPCHDFKRGPLVTQRLSRVGNYWWLAYVSSIDWKIGHTKWAFTF